MQVKDLMTCNVQSITPDATIRRAALTMSALNVGFLPVAEDGHATGVLTDRDIALRVAAAGRNPSETAVRDVMTSRTENVSEESDVRDALALMRNKKIRRVLVVRADDTLAGVVSLGDLATALDDRQLCAEVLKEISEPCAPKR